MGHVYGWNAVSQETKRYKEERYGMHSRMQNAASVRQVYIDFINEAYSTYMEKERCGGGLNM